MKRPAVGEQAHQFLAADARPVADIADVHVDEGRTRGRIIADAAALHLEADIAQLLQRHAGDVEIHRLAEHVLALLRHAPGAAAQHGVGRRRAITADDLDVARGAAFAIRLPDQVKQARVHLDRFVAAPVAQDVVDLLETVGKVAPVALIDDLRLLVRMQVIELERARLGPGGQRRRDHGAQDQQGRQPFGPDVCVKLPSVVESFDSVQIKWPCRLPFVPGSDQRTRFRSCPIIEPNG